MSLSVYANVIDALMKDIVDADPLYGTHPRLRILGQLEARMTDADLIVVAGLDEKTWPPEASHDPWMSRPMRAEFGLPPPKRQIGLAAHDFVQGFCAPHVVLTPFATSGWRPGRYGPLAPEARGRSQCCSNQTRNHNRVPRHPLGQCHGRGNIGHPDPSARTATAR